MKLTVLLLKTVIDSSVGIIKKRLTGPTLREFSTYEYLFRNKRGLEIGGKSIIFTEKGVLPIYGVADCIDGLNFASNTLWEEQLRVGQPYVGSGKQFIGEASLMEGFTEGNYDFIVSSHCLEHIANPLKAISNWLRLLKERGALLLVVPDRRYSFDHRRHVASFGHLLEDFNNDIGEDDLTHLSEILRLHDLAMDLPAGSAENFKNRCLDNFNIRGMHHHCFDEDLLREIYRYFRMKILFVKSDKPNNLIILGVL